MRTTSALLAVAALGAPLAEGYYKYVALIPNGGNVPDSPNIGHLTEDGTTGLNDFGDAFETAGNEWNTKLCQEDTDGDGYTNGQELGDPCCTWTATNTADLITDGISHPSDASQIPTSSELLAGCTSSSTTTTSGSTNGTSGDDVNDVLAPVSAGSSSAMPTDDDEDDSDEMAETTGSAAATAALSALAALVSAAVTTLAL